MKSFYLLSAICLVPFMSACSDNGPEPGPEICPDPLLPENVLVHSSGNYNCWTDAGGKIEIRCSTEVTSPIKAKVLGYTLEIDGGDFGYYDYPLESCITLDAHDFGHGRHEMTLYALVEDTLGRQVAKPALEDMSFVVFDVIPDFDISATLDAKVSSVSTSGEKYEESFTVESSADGRFILPEDKFSWTPEVGSSSGLDVELTISKIYPSCPVGLEGTVGNVQWNLPDGGTLDEPALKLSWSNPVKFEEWHGLTPSFLMKFKGTYEGIEFNDSTYNGFVVVVR